jgi:hypothetical protein
MERATETDLYDRDFALWVKAQVDALREGRLSAVDVENVTEELEALAKRDRRELQNRLRVLGAHLLKKRYQPEKASRSWDATIYEQSMRIRAVLKDSPSLRRELPDFLFAGYEDAANLAGNQTGLTFSEPDNEFIDEWCFAIGEFDSVVRFDARRKFDEYQARIERMNLPSTRSGMISKKSEYPSTDPSGPETPSE